MLEFYPGLNTLNDNFLKKMPSPLQNQHVPTSSIFHNKTEIKTFKINTSQLNGTTASSSVDGDLIKQEINYEICEGCGQKIQDRYLMRLTDTSWHESCLICSVCGILLSHSCYTRNTKLYCKLDYDKIYGVKCTKCGDCISAQELVMRAQNYIYHLQCFVCIMCLQPLQKGEQFILRAGQLFCRHDFEKELYFLQQINHSSDDDYFDDHISRSNRDGRRGPKRPRTILTSAQRRQFKAAFEQSPKPCRKVREALAKDTGLSVRVVQVWFQNQRAKIKKIQRKAKIQDGDSKTGSKLLTEKDIKQESQDYLGLAKDYSSSRPLNPFSPDDNYTTNSNDSFCSSDLSLDDSTTFDQLDEQTSDTMSSIQNLDDHHAQEPTTAHTNSIQINPIDKLYLMQNSYFSSDQ